MNSVNSVTLLGKIVRLPEEKIVSSHKKLSFFSISTEDEDNFYSSDIHLIIATGNLADSIKECKKGDIIYIEGSIKTRSWLNKVSIKIFKTEIIAKKIIVMSQNNKKNEDFFYASKKDFYS